MKSVNAAPLLGAVGVLLSCGVHHAHAQFASTVSGYTAGQGANPRYNAPESALGQPARVNPFGDAVTPFNPPYDVAQLVSIGVGGSLTLAFPEPIANRSITPFGLDFQIFGGGGFIITNAFDADFNWIGEPATDGSMFGGGDAVTRVSVSTDGSTWFTLDPSLAPAVEALFPTDGAGDFSQPVDPSLRLSDFAGMTLDGLRQRYAGSGGGTGFDISWARDSQGSAIALDSIQFVRVDVLNGKVEVDAIGAVAAIPEPQTWMLVLAGGAAWFIRRRIR